jgi:hypothetical protein
VFARLDLAVRLSGRITKPRGDRNGVTAMLKKKFNKYVSEATLESGFDLQIWLKEPYVFSVTGAGSTFFAFDDFDSMEALWKAANECCEEEITKPSE